MGKRKAEDSQDKDESKALAKSIKKQLASAADGTATLKELRKATGQTDLDKAEFKAAAKAAAAASKGAFTIEGKVVKAAEASTPPASVVTGEKEGEDGAKKKKKAKKDENAQTDTSGASGDLKAIEKWREEKMVQISVSVASLFFLLSLSFFCPRSTGMYVLLSRSPCLPWS